MRHPSDLPFPPAPFLTAWLAAVIMVRGAASPAASSPETIFYSHMCDASAAVALDSDHFAVANDEDNPIRIFRAAQGGPPLRAVDLSRFLILDKKKPEADFEAACWLDNHIFWISSHGRNREGEFRLSRHAFFATQPKKTDRGLELAPVGKPYRRLLVDLIREPRLRGFGLDRASRLPPKAPGGFNIEGLCQTLDRHLLIGFRNPIPRGQALLVPLLNPFDLLAGNAAAFGEPILLDLGGLGVRDIASWRGQYLIVAGSFDGKGQSQLFLWPGRSQSPRKLEAIQFQDFNPEAVVVYPGNDPQVQILSDDGTRMVQGKPCKQLPNPADKSFRAIWVTVPEN